MTQFVIAVFFGGLAVGNCPRTMDRVARRFGWEEDSGKPFFLMLMPFACLGALAAIAS